MCCLIFAYAQLFSTSSCQCEHPVKPRTVLQNGHHKLVVHYSWHLVMNHCFRSILQWIEVGSKTDLWIINYRKTIQVLSPKFFETICPTICMTIPRFLQKSVKPFPENGMNLCGNFAAKNKYHLLPRKKKTVGRTTKPWRVTRTSRCQWAKVSSNFDGLVEEGGIGVGIYCLLIILMLTWC